MNGQRWPTNGVALSPPVLVALYLRRHCWSRPKIAKVMGISPQTLDKHMHTAARTLGVNMRELDGVIMRGGEFAPRNA